MEVAKRARELVWDGKFPVDPVQIGEQLIVTRSISGQATECSIEFQPMSDEALNNLSGFAELDTSASAPVFICAYNKDEAQVRQRFTQAHELGHVLLKHVNESNRKMRDHNFRPGTDKLEMEANAFAAELLMPEQYMEAMTRKTPDISQLADQLGVSMTALRYRLRNLGLL